MLIEQKMSFLGLMSASNWLSALCIRWNLFSPATGHSIVLSAINSWQVEHGLSWLNIADSPGSIMLHSQASYMLSDLLYLVLRLLLRRQSLYGVLTHRDSTVRFQSLSQR